MSPGKTWRVTTDALLATFAWSSKENLKCGKAEAVATSCFLLLFSRPSARRANGFDCEAPAGACSTDVCWTSWEMQC